MFSPLTSRLNEPVGLWYHGAALLYAVSAYILGWFGLFASNWLTNAGAMLLLGHAMIIAAYLTHECGHNLVFRSIQGNAKLGRVLSWLCGSSYGAFEDPAEFRGVGLHSRLVRPLCFELADQCWRDAVARACHDYRCLSDP